MTKFKPCPFCGGKAEYSLTGSFDGWSGKVFCGKFCSVWPRFNSGTYKSIAHVKETLEKVWNKRHG